MSSMIVDEIEGMDAVEVARKGREAASARSIVIESPRQKEDDTIKRTFNILARNAVQDECRR
jgi:hypothetical protein